MTAPSEPRAPRLQYAMFFASIALATHSTPLHASICEDAAAVIVAVVDARKAGVDLQTALAAADDGTRDAMADFIASSIRTVYAESKPMPTDTMHADQRRAYEIMALMQCYDQFGTD